MYIYKKSLQHTGEICRTAPGLKAGIRSVDPCLKPGEPAWAGYQLHRKCVARDCCRGKTLTYYPSNSPK
jgi:hypothetical protein